MCLSISLFFFFFLLEYLGRNLLFLVYRRLPYKGQVEEITFEWPTSALMKMIRLEINSELKLKFVIYLGFSDEYINQCRSEYVCHQPAKTLQYFQRKNLYKFIWCDGYLKFAPRWAVFIFLFTCFPLLCML